MSELITGDWQQRWTRKIAATLMDISTKRKIEVVDYDPSWPGMFEQESKLLSRTLGNIVEKIHHIGSTSVPGLAAKPIIDILVEVTSLENLDARHQQMVTIGYQPKGEFGIPGRRYFQRGETERTHQVHAYLAGDANIIRHLAFRDYIMTNPSIAAEYAQLKKSVARTCDHDIDRYCQGKDAFIKEHEARAIQPGSQIH